MNHELRHAGAFALLLELPGSNSRQIRDRWIGSKARLLAGDRDDCADVVGAWLDSQANATGSRRATSGNRVVSFIGRRSGWVARGGAEGRVCRDGLAWGHASLEHNRRISHAGWLLARCATGRCCKCADHHPSCRPLRVALRVHPRFVHILNHRRLPVCHAILAAWSCQNIAGLERSDWSYLEFGLGKRTRWNGSAIPASLDGQCVARPGGARGR